MIASSYDYYRYLRDGRATIKSDVYAFGVVLFEIISGKEAVIRTEGIATKNSERRSLVSIVRITASPIRKFPNAYFIYDYGWSFYNSMLCVSKVLFFPNDSA